MKTHTRKERKPNKQTGDKVGGTLEEIPICNNNNSNRNRGNACTWLVGWWRPNQQTNPKPKKIKTDDCQDYF